MERTAIRFIFLAGVLMVVQTIAGGLHPFGWDTDIVLVLGRAVSFCLETAIAMLLVVLVQAIRLLHKDLFREDKDEEYYE